MRKKIVSLDFDGVIHSYTSGWKGPRCIPDPPVDGALEAIIRYVQAGFRVCIFSSRGRYVGGRQAMKQYLRYHYGIMGALGDTVQGWDAMPKELRRWIGETAFADPYSEELEYAISRLMREIKFPLFKPPATMSIDDRGFCFRGTFPSVDDVREFQPWYGERRMFRTCNDMVLLDTKEAYIKWIKEVGCFPLEENATAMEV